MAASSRGLFRPLLQKPDFVCSRCMRFSTTTIAQSGHNRWSKIKHDKGSADAKKNAQRSVLAHEITLCSRLYGSDPNVNSKLAAILATAKKAGFPKAGMEAAVARGQGRSLTGATLELCTLEAIMPPSIAMVIDIETDKKLRSLPDIRHIVKAKGGSVTPTNYLFQRKGRVSFEQDERKLSVDDVLEQAIEAGAEDVEADEDGNIVVWTDANMTHSAANELQESLGLKVLSSDIIWDANKDTVFQLENDADAESLAHMIDALREHPDVQGVFANVAQGSVSDDAWSRLDLD
ncbi:DUF28 domain-containing protein [Phlyctema vagabunda]|uniref:DUF28 domain-containing protein n=1 Tax=Phlyctema vagabunda TaxID=108571 RepID=A0ABR4PRD8_9HELO